MKLSAWTKVAANLAPHQRAQKYATWRNKKTMPEVWIDAIESTYPTTAEQPKGVGLGDVIKKVTDALGIKQCGGCKKRQEILNKLRFGG
jgi:hypothetical protein